MHASDTWPVFKRSVSEFISDDAMTLGAALAFYAALSLAPLLTLFLWITGFLGPSAQQQFVSTVQQYIGERAGRVIEMIISNAAQQPTAQTIAGIVSIATIVFGATGVFAQLQAALNRIWDVEPRPGQGAWGWLRKRALSLLMIVVLAALLLALLAASAALTFAAGRMGDALPGTEWLWTALNIIITLAVTALLFAAIYKVMPDVRIEWRDVFLGAAVTAVLFAIGKFLIGWYLGSGSVGSAYGAAGALIALLVWVYYSSLILFFGAELTQVWAHREGRRITPDAHAQWADSSMPGGAPKPA